MPHAGGAVNGVGNGGGGGVDHDLADGFCAKGLGGLKAGFKFHLQFAHIQARGQAVLHKGVFQNLPPGAVGDIFHQRVADALHNAALGLNAGQSGVDGGAAVHHGLIVQHGHHAGAGVHLDLGHAHHVGRGRNRRGAAGGGFGGVGAVELRFYGKLRKAYKALLTAQLFYAALHEFQRILGAGKQLGRNADQIFFQLVAGFAHGLAGQVGGGGSIRAGIVGGGIGVGTENGHLIHRAIHAFGGHLCQNGVAAGAHIRSTDHQIEGAVVCQAHHSRAHIQIGNARALHGHGHTGGANAAVAHIPHGVFMLPVKDLAAALHAAVQRAGAGGFAVVGGHIHTLPQHVGIPQARGVLPQLFGQLVHGRFQRKQALGCAVAAVGTGGLHIGVHHIITKAEGLQRGGVQRNGFVPRKAHRGGAMLAVSARVGKGVQVQHADAALFAGTQTHAHLHFVAGRACDLGFLTGVDDLGRAAGFERHKGRVNIAHSGLLGAKAAADARLFHADAAFGNAQRIGKNAARVEHDLRGADHVQAAVYIHLTVGAEGFHHGLIEGPGVVGAVDHNVAVGHHGIHITVLLQPAGHQIAPVVAAHRAGREPILLGVYQKGVVLGGAEIQQGFQHLIFHLDQLQGFLGGLFVLGGHNGHGIAHKAHMAV